MAAPTKDAVARIAWADFYVQLVAEGASGNPDVMDDLCRRAREAFKDCLQSLIESGLLDIDEAEETE